MSSKYEIESNKLNINNSHFTSQQASSNLINQNRR